jgi:mono/diheme cytochrome c family protein
MTFNFVVILLMLFALPLHAGPLELSPEEVRRDLRSEIREVTVIEPHAQCGERKCVVTYVGVPLRTLVEQYYSEEWRDFSGEIHFIARDGYLGIVEATKAREKDAYLTFARADGNPFIVDNNQQNERNVLLGPFYLVWDNIEDSDLQQMGSYGWPYQVDRIQLVSESFYSGLIPPDTPPVAQAGFMAFKTYCLGCHQINGVGGRKVETDMKLLVHGKTTDELRRWISDPQNVRPGTMMPPINMNLDQQERDRIIDQILGFLGVL